MVNALENVYFYNNVILTQVFSFFVCILLLCYIESKCQFHVVVAMLAKSIPTFYLLPLFEAHFAILGNNSLYGLSAGKFAQ